MTKREPKIMEATPEMIAEQNNEILAENMKLKINKDFFEKEATHWRERSQYRDRAFDRKEDAYLKCIRTMHNAIAQLDLDISNLD